MSYLLLGLDAVLCGVFGVSAWSKLVAQPAFAASLRPLRLVPDRLVRHVASGVTAVELAIALGLGWAIAAGIGRAPAGHPVGLASLTLAGVFLAVITAGIALELRRDTQATCACFGASERPLSRRHLVRNGLLIGVALAGLAARASGAGTAGTAGIAGAAVSLAAGAIVGLTLIRLDDIVELFTPIHHPKAGSTTRS